MKVKKPKPEQKPAEAESPDLHPKPNDLWPAPQHDPGATSDNANTEG